MTQQDIITLIARTRKGDQDAYAELIKAFQGMVFALVLNITGNYSDSEDVVQDTFLRAYEKLGTLKHAARFPSWLSMIARRLAWDFMRKKHRIMFLGNEDLFQYKVASTTETPADEASRKEMKTILWREVARLSPKLRESIFLFYVEDFSIKDASDFLGISEGAFKSRLKSARDQLRDELSSLVENEFRKHEPAEETRKKILSALPALALPHAGDSAPATAGALSFEKISFLGLSLQQILPLSIALIIAIAAVTIMLTKGAPQSQQNVFIPQTVATPKQNRVIEQAVVFPTMTPQPLLTVEDGYTLSGTILMYSADIPAQGVDLTLKKDDKVIASVQSDDKGLFSFEGLDEGTYLLYMSTKDAASQQRYFIDPRSRPVRIRIIDSNITDLMLTVNRASLISGRILDIHSQPVGDAEVIVDRKYGWEDAKHAITDKQGRFAITGLANEGLFTIKVDAFGYSPAFLANIGVAYDRPVTGLDIIVEEGSGATVSGRLVNQEKKPVAGQIVWCQSGEDYYQKTATDVNGVFSFVRLFKGTWTLKPNPYLYPYVEKKITLEADSKLQNIEIEVEQSLYPGYISGKVVNHDGTPAKDGMIKAYPPIKDGGRKLYGIAYTDDSGNFMMYNLPDDLELDLCYEKIPLSQQTDAVSIMAPIDDLKVIVSVSRFEVTDFQVRLIPLSGQILDAITLEPIRQFKVGSCTGVHMSGNPVHIYDPEGKFQLTDIPVQALMGISVEANGYRDYITRLEVDESTEQLNLKVLMESGGRIMGRVVDQEGNPVASARVFIEVDEKNQVLSNAKGEFDLRNIRNTQDSSIWVLHPSCAPAEKGHITVTDQTVIKDLLFTLTPGGSIEGFILDTDQKPLSEQVVRITSDKIHPVYQYKNTSVDGMYYFEHLAPGEYKVSVEKTDFARKIVQVEENKVTLCDFGKDQTTLHGVVTLNGKPLPNVELLLSDTPDYYARSSTSLKYTKTDENGGYQIQGISPGVYYLHIRGQDTFSDANERIVIDRSDKLKKDISLLTTTITGKVVFPDTSPGDNTIRNLNISLLPRQILRIEHDAWKASYNMRSIAATHIEENGQFKLEGIAPGEYTLRLHSINYGSLFKDIVVEAGIPLTDVIFNLASSGQLNISIVNADNNEPIAYDVLYLALIDSQDRFEIREYLNRKGDDFSGKGFVAGIYQMAVCNPMGKPHPYLSPIVPAVTIPADETTDLQIPVRLGTQVNIEVKNKSGIAISDFQYNAYDESGDLILFAGKHEETIEGILPFGKVRLVLRKDTDIIYDKVISIPKTDGASTYFVSEITLDELNN